MHCNIGAQHFVSHFKLRHFSLCQLSDAQRVLHKSSGTEPAAAQLLDSVFQTRECRECRATDSQPTILSSLLGPDLDAQALKELEQGRYGMEGHWGLL